MPKGQTKNGVGSVTKRPLIDWNSVDWSLSNRTIARQLQCAPSAVWLYRRRLGKPPAPSIKGVFVGYQGVDWSLTNKDIATQLRITLQAVRQARVRRAAAAAQPAAPDRPLHGGKPTPDAE